MKEEISLQDQHYIKEIIRKYYEYLYGDRFGHLGEMDKLFKRCKLQKLTQEIIDYLNSLLSFKEIEFAAKRNLFPQ